MRRDSLVDFFADFDHHAGTFLVYDDGYRARSFGYAQVARAARHLALRLDETGLVKGNTVLFWGENRPGWIVAFWACILRGVVVVPVDYHASADFVDRVRAIVDARLVLVGDEVDPTHLGTTTRWRLRDLEDIPASDPPALPSRPLTADDVAEIIFTSGATAEPKGVVITHRNVLANIVPVEREVRKYRRYARPFAPIRFVNLLPLSHMFGQAMATFIPPMLPGVVIFLRTFNPQEIVRQIRERRVSVLVSVPKILDVLAEHVRRQYPVVAAEPRAGEHWVRRWWRYRDVHRALGWKFWSFVVGAAPLEPSLEEFWGRLGFVVIQGYGLTETAPIVTLNHPFAARKGSVGKPIAGVEVRIAEDGEILVRGDNVTQGYYNAPDETARAFEDGWLHTGDIGGLDESGRLYIRGRKKEMIVTPEGLNVFPEDVESALTALPGVEDAAVVGRRWNGEERVHAVLVLTGSADPDVLMREANRSLGDHQRIRSVSVWPLPSLPRTEGTRKLKRREIKRWVEGDPGVVPAADRDATLESVLSRFVHTTAPIRDVTTIDELGLSSLERVELLMALEDRFEVTIDETAFAGASTVGALRRLVEPGEALAGPPAGRALPSASDDGAVAFPRWSRSAPVRLLRRVSLATWVLPLARAFAWLRVEGTEHLRALEGPVILAANHQSHMDTPAILAALPPRLRYRLAVAMAKEFFKAHFHPREHPWRAVLTSRLNYGLAVWYFNAFPLPQRDAGARETLRYIGELLSDGYSVLIFPEGKRTAGGELAPFRQGVGMIGSRLGVPVVPVRLEGLHRILHQSWKMARPGHAVVRFGRALMLEGDDYAAQAARVEDAVRALGGDERDARAASRHRQ